MNENIVFVYLIWTKISVLNFRLRVFLFKDKDVDKKILKVRIKNID